MDFDYVVWEAMQEIQYRGLPETNRLAVCALDAALRNAMERKWPASCS